MLATTSIELKRHYTELSPKETDELVEAVADLIVNFLKGGVIPSNREKAGRNEGTGAIRSAIPNARGCDEIPA